MIVQLVAQPGRRSWRDSALCLQIDSDLFHPEKGGSVRAAKRVCGRCPVQDSCLREVLDIEAVTRGRVTGVWGGTSELDRRRMQRANRQAGAA